MTTIVDAVSIALPFADLGEKQRAKRQVTILLGIEPSARVRAFSAHHAYSMKYRPMSPMDELTDFAKGVWQAAALAA